MCFHKVFFIKTKRRMETFFKNARPQLGDSSIATYVSIIKGLSKQMKQDFSDPMDVIKHSDAILSHLQSVQPSTRKTRLACLIVFISKTPGNEPAVEAFRKRMMKDKETVEEEDKKQTTTERQDEGWLPWEELMSKYVVLKKEVAPLLKKDALDKREFQRVQTFVLLSCLLLVPPRRSLDYTAFKIGDINPETDNFLLYEKRKPYMVFNQYKTVKTYGIQRIPVPTLLHNILKQWMRLNPHPYLLMNYGQTAHLNQTQLTQLLYKFFDKPISTSMIRHLYLTEKYKDVPAVKEMEATATAMGHSVKEALTVYTKKK